MNSSLNPKKLEQLKKLYNDYLSIVKQLEVLENNKHHSKIFLKYNYSTIYFNNELNKKVKNLLKNELTAYKKQLSVKLYMDFKFDTEK